MASQTDELEYPYHGPYNEKGHLIRVAFLLKNPTKSGVCLVGGAGIEPATLAV